MNWITQSYCNLAINPIRWHACNRTECVSYPRLSVNLFTQQSWVFFIICLSWCTKCFHLGNLCSQLMISPSVSEALEWFSMTKSCNFLLPSNSRWANIFHEIAEYLTFQHSCSIVNVILFFKFCFYSIFFLEGGISSLLCMVMLFISGPYNSTKLGKNWTNFNSICWFVCVIYCEKEW